MPELSGIVELTLETDDLDGLTDFYAGQLGLEVLERDSDRVWLAVGTTTRLGLWSPGRKEYGDRGGRHVHFAFSAAPGDLEPLAERLRAAGVERLRGPVEHDGGDRSLYFADPAGNLVEVWDFLAHGRGAHDGMQALA
jgi:catechol-2,3-dioxygenase